MSNASAVIFGEALLYSTPWDDKVEFPEDTVDYGSAWSTPGDQNEAWTARGYTQDGINLSMTVDRDTIGADQVLDPLFRPITGRDVSISSNLIEMTAANLQLGLGQGKVSTTAPGPTARGYDEFALEASATDDYNAWGLDAEQPEDGEPFRVVVWKGLASDGVDTTFGNRSTAGQIGVNIMALPDDSSTPTRILTIRDYVPASGS